jgi:predicted metal-dependent hydrolase
MLTVMTTPAEVLHIGDLDVHVRVSDHRQNIRLTIERDATVTAVVPPQTDPAKLAQVITAKRQWLYAKLRERAANGEPRPPREYVTGEGFPYLGRSYRLLIVKEAPQSVLMKRGRLELRQDSVKAAARHLTRWYRNAGEPWLRKRSIPWVARMGIEVASLQVLPLGYRWGSCSQHGKINIHWATMQLPPELVDYVLVHELAHLEQPDHGPDFWHIVERTMPDCASRRERLRHLGPDLWLPEVLAVRVGAPCG